MCLMAGMELTIRAVREQIASAVDLVIHQARMKDGSRRFIQVTEVVGMEGDVITLQDIFLFDFRAGIDENGRFRGSLQPTGLRPRFLNKLEDHGVTIPASLFMPPVPGGKR
jgi:pilus assembly protein CpaF